MLNSQELFILSKIWRLDKELALALNVSYLDFNSSFSLESLEISQERDAFIEVENSEDNVIMTKSAREQRRGSSKNRSSQL